MKTRSSTFPHADFNHFQISEREEKASNSSSCFLCKTSFFKSSSWVSQLTEKHYFVQHEGVLQKPEVISKQGESNHKFWKHKCENTVRSTKLLTIFFKTVCRATCWSWYRRKRSLHNLNKLVFTIDETKDIHIQEYFLLLLSTEQSISLKLKWLQKRIRNKWTVEQ